MFGQLAESIGIDVRVLRLLFTLLAGIPISFTYKHLFINNRKRVIPVESSWPQHLFSVVVGLCLSYFNYGMDTLHFLVIISVSWLILRVGGPSFSSAATLFVWTFGYLLTSYVYYATDEYDLNWTTSYCVMCLRLIGFGMDYYDGRKSRASPAPSTSHKSGGHSSIAKKMDVIKSNWDNVALHRLPSLLETFGYCFFFSGFMVGPQFPFMLYERFVTLRLFQLDQNTESSSNADTDENKAKKDAAKIFIPSCAGYAVKCFVLALFYMAITQVGQIYFPSAYVLSKQYQKFPFWKKFVYMTLSGRVALIKYLGVWLLNEVSCVLVGLAYVPPHSPTDVSTAKWNGLSNVDPRTWEFVNSLGQVIASFNMNTNMWCKNYLFKRLKFLGSKELSSLGTLMFLAIWHGWAPAYFAVFFTEFVDMEAERRLKQWTHPLWNWAYLSAGPLQMSVRFFGRIICYLLTISTLSYASIAFDLLLWHKCVVVWSSLYWYGHISVFSIILLGLVLPQKKHHHHGHTAQQKKDTSGKLGNVAAAVKKEI